MIGVKYNVHLLGLPGANIIFNNKMENYVFQVFNCPYLGCLMSNKRGKNVIEHEECVHFMFNTISSHSAYFCHQGNSCIFAPTLFSYRPQFKTVELPERRSLSQVDLCY